MSSLLAHHLRGTFTGVVGAGAGSGGLRASIGFPSGAAESAPHTTAASI
jgi:hypothetical protein